MTVKPFDHFRFASVFGARDAKATRVLRAAHWHQGPISDEDGISGAAGA